MSSDAGLTSGFTGCIKNARVNTHDLDFSAAVRGRGVTECDNNPCDLIQCYNGGTCTDIDRQFTYGCVCPHAFKGDNCERMIANNCTIGNHMCHPSSQCVFNYVTETYECFCPLTPDPRGGQFCEDSETEIHMHPVQKLLVISHLLIPVINFNKAKFSGNSFASYLYPSQTLQTVIKFNISSQANNGLVFYVPQVGYDDYSIQCTIHLDGSSLL